jgi:predicted transcriptional regulator
MVQTRRHRGQSEVIEKILAIALNGACATRIVYGANIDFRRFKSLSSNLVGKKLLTVEQGSGAYGKIYRTTDRGRTLLTLLNKVRSLV